MRMSHVTHSRVIYECVVSHTSMLPRGMSPMTRQYSRKEQLKTEILWVLIDFLRVHVYVHNTHIYMFFSIHICAHKKHANVCIHMCIHVNACITEVLGSVPEGVHCSTARPSQYTCTYTTHIYTHVLVDINVYTYYTYVFEYTYVYIHLYVHVCLCTSHLHEYTCMYMYMHVCTCIYLYI